ncbi:MAG: DUF4837 family protein [Bacteroidales bacterium]|nr:DUF4837 family protein [Bacteroidales bacterium]
MRSLKIIKIAAIFPIVILMATCKPTEKKPMLPSVTGLPGDLAIVIDKSDWDTRPGEEIRKIFEEPVQVLPQYEPLYDLMFVPHSAFNSVLQPFRNILKVNIDGKYKDPKVVVQNEVYSKSQILFNLYAKDDSAFVKLINDNKGKILALLEDAERNRLTEHFKNNLNERIFNSLKDKYNITLYVPREYKTNIDSGDFVWLYHEIGAVTLGIFVYEYSYTDTNTFTPGYLIEKRNSLLKKYVQGEVEGSYMTTETLFGPVFNQYLLRGKHYVAELKGLWRMEKGVSMGGPFISITTLDEKRNKIITVEGFVFAAGEDKRSYLRQVEAIVLSLEILDNQR